MLRAPRIAKPLASQRRATSKERSRTAAATPRITPITVCWTTPIHGTVGIRAAAAA